MFRAWLSIARTALGVEILHFIQDDKSGVGFFDGSIRVPAPIAMRALALLLFLMPLGAVAQSTSADSTGRIVGLVTDAETGEALPGANALLVGTTLGAATDLYGHFVIEDVPVGLYNIQALFPGFKTATIEEVEVKPSVSVQVLIALSMGGCEWVMCHWYYPAIPRDPFASRRFFAEEPNGSCCPVPGIALDYLPISR